MSYAKFVCPKCEAEENPMLHTVYSSCRGQIKWVGNYLVCEDCEETISSFRCDECGATPSKNACAS